MLTDEQIRQLAAELHQSERTRRQVEHFSRRFPGMTIDDGYLDNRHAWEALPAGVPVMIYLTTGHIGGETLWVYRLTDAALQTRLTTARFDELGIGELFHLALAGSPGNIARPGEGACHPIDGLSLPGRDHRVVHAMLGCQLRQRQVTPDRLQRHLRLKIRAVALSRRLHSRTNPSGRE